MAKIIKELHATFKYGEWKRKRKRDGRLIFRREGFYTISHSYYHINAYEICEEIQIDGFVKHYDLSIYRDKRIIHAYTDLSEDKIILILNLNDDGYTIIKYEVNDFSDLYRKLKEFGFVVKNWRKMKFEKKSWEKQFWSLIYNTVIGKKLIEKSHATKDMQVTLMQVALANA